MRRLTETLLIFLSILLLTSGCGSGSQEIVIEPWDVLLANLENAWNNRDMTLLITCFRDDFIHHLQEEDWDDYDGDGIIDTYWGLDLELDFAEEFFDDADSIFFSLSGGDAYMWPDDSTGQSIQMHRILTKEIWSQSDTTLEVRPVTLICRPDSQSEWYIWQWFDEEEQK